MTFPPYLPLYCVLILTMPITYRQEELYDLYGLKDTMVQLIQEYDTIGLCRKMDSKPSLVKLMIDSRDYMVLYREACTISNVEALDVLIGYGFSMDHLNFKDMGDYDMWAGNPVSIALNNSDIPILEKLLSIGFKASCPGCLYSGTPEVCVITTVFRDITISEENFVRILRAADPVDVIESFLKYMNVDFNSSNAQSFLDSICKTIPSMLNLNVSVTRSNKEFVMGMVCSGILDVDSMLQKIMDNMLGYSYNFFYAGAHGSIIQVSELRDFTRELLDLGADTEKVMNISATLVYNELSSVIGGGVYTTGSIFDILGSSRENKNITIDTIVDTKMCTRKHIDELFVAIDYLYDYVRYVRRQPFIRKKVVGVGGEYIDLLTARFLTLESPIFSRIVTYLV